MDLELGGQFYVEKKSRNSMKKVTILVNVDVICHETQQSLLADLQDDTARTFVLPNSSCDAFYTISTSLEIHHYPGAETLRDLSRIMRYM